MSGTTHRHELPDTHNVLHLHPDAKIISARWWKGAVCVWVQTPVETAETKARLVQVYGTGWPIEGETGRFIDTVLIPENGLVFHVYELEP